ncbi:MAG TPA: hypothetical protein VMV49_08830 [Candidatus Deferrimicrobium sp.]|nr:hypothetical protein [Candidatus Deferrimicrobium sp.]
MSQNEFDQLALDAVTYLISSLNIVPTIYAYLWTLDNGGTYLNNFTIYGIPYYLVGDDYHYFKSSLQSEIVYFAELIFSTPQLLLIKDYNWYNILYQDLRIVDLFGVTAKPTAIEYEINISDYTYETLLSNATSYAANADLHDQAISIMSTSILLLAISAVIIGFLIQVKLKKLNWISLLIGIFVAIIALYMFGLALFYIL